MNLITIGKAVLTGKNVAVKLSKDEGKKSWLSYYLDMIRLSITSYISPERYVENEVFSMTSSERKAFCEKSKDEHKQNREWVKLYRSNLRFNAKWTKEKYSSRPFLSYLRSRAYKKHFHLTNVPVIQYGVHIICEHRIEFGKNVLLARNVDIDYTGDLIVDNNVYFSEGVKVLTHNHSTGMEKTNMDKGCVLTPLVIHDHVWIGTRAIIMPGVKEIGRGAIISADSFINSKIPPYAIVMGNPAKIVGFKQSPEEILEYEIKHYEEKDRIPADIIYANYDKYFRRRWKEIKQWTRL